MRICQSTSATENSAGGLTTKLEVHSVSSGSRSRGGTKHGRCVCGGIKVIPSPRAVGGEGAGENQGPEPRSRRLLGQTKDFCLDPENNRKPQSDFKQAGDISSWVSRRSLQP